MIENNAAGVTMTFSKNAQNIISLLEKAGYEAYFVGGCVRDFYMHRPFDDIDITTSALPAEVEDVLGKNKIRCVETGIKHGTVTALYRGESFEITTYRCDGEYKDNRRPETVTFVKNIEADLARRDFTINAIAYSGGKTVDIFGGTDDINKKIIRCVGNPDIRFKEDALRIMRAVRFSSVLGFDIEPNTKKSLFSNKNLLLNIAPERIFTELKKLLLGKNVSDVLIEYKEIIAVCVPELMPCFNFKQNTKWHIYDVYTHIAKSVGEAPPKDYMRLTLLLHDIGKPYCLKVDEHNTDHFKGHQEKSAALARRALKRLRADNKTVNKVVTLISVHDEYITRADDDIKRWLRLLGEDATLDYIDVKIADLKSHNLEYSQREIDELYYIKEKTLSIINSGEAYKISDLKINGADLLSLGYSGSEISSELDYLIDAVSKDPALNKRKTLLKLAVERTKKNCDLKQ